MNVNELLQMVISGTIPEFAKLCQQAKYEKVPLIMHQDAFSMDTSTIMTDIFNLGAAIKYAGMSGIPIVIIGSNDETLSNENWSNDTKDMDENLRNVVENLRYVQHQIKRSHKQENC